MGITRVLDRTKLANMQSDRFREMLRSVAPANRFYNRKLAQAGIGVDDLKSPADLSLLRFTDKVELLEDHAANPPYGTNLSRPLGDYCRMHQTSGSKGQPLRWLDTRESWQWFLDCWKIIYETVGLTP